MKIMKQILCGIFGLLALLNIFIFICAVNPSLADSVSGFLVVWRPSSVNIDEENLLRAEWDAPSMILADDMEPVPPVSGERLQEPSFNYGPKNPSETDYIPPEISDISVPKRVSGKNGYEPVREDTEQINEEEARQIQDRVTYGDTGDDFNFDVEYYPYYGMLDTDQQKVYGQLYANATIGNAVFAPVGQVTPSQFREVFLAVFNDHPEIFWLDSTYQGKALLNGEVVEVTLYFNQTADDLEASKAAFEKAAEEILAGARSTGSAYEREVYVHNALLDRTEYNPEAPLNQNAYSALVNGQTVCAGYARAFQYLMRQLQVPCYYCIGYAGERHAWNVIKLGGDYYNVDTTWNDTDPNTFDFFNKTDRDFASTHVREELSVYLPACNGTAYGNPRNGATPYYEKQIVDLNSNQNIAPNNPKPGMEEYGFSERNVLKNMEDYYADCYNQIMQITQSGGSMRFQNVIEGNMWDACVDAYNSDGYAKGYANRILSELSAAYCKVRITAEDLKDSRLLLQHDITIEY